MVGYYLMRAIRHKIDVCGAVAFATFKEYIAYRTHMMISLFVGPAFFAVQYFIWGAIYGNGDSVIAGLEYEQMIRYFGITALIAYLTWGSADWNLSMLIRTGRFLTFTLRPVHHRLFALSQKIGHRILAFFMEFLPCGLLFTLIFGVSLRPAYFGWFVLSAILASLIHFYVSYCIGLFSFWLVQSNGLRSAYGLIAGIFAGSIVPLVLFPYPLQILQFFLPFQYTSYVPAMVFLGEYRLGGIEMSIPAIVGVQAAATLVMLVISEIMYRSALKRFTAVGA
ncbi:MAG: ABC-2 family transporter protein [Oscillospiraceae bacterium]|nr:ABC-2 family transporter protein [Oscillospiraceae bacterium]